MSSRLFRTAVPAAVLLALLPAPPSSAGTPVVTKTADSLDGTCDADCSLREAIIAGNLTPEPDTIQLAAGTYTLTIEGDTEDASEFGDLDVLNDLTIAGAGPGATIIDGAWATNPDRILQALGADLVLTGLTVRDGNESAYGSGGVFVDTGSSLMATDVDFRDNHGDFAGAVANTGAATLARVRFVGNVGESSSSGGGAFYNLPMGTTSLTDVAFIGNTSSCCGGAMYVEGTETTLTNVTFSGNSASRDGGALYVSQSVSVTNATFSGNTITGVGNGAAVLMSSGSATTLNDVTITGNAVTGTGDGGGIYQDGGTLMLGNSIIAGNSDAGGQSPDCGQMSGDAFTSGGHNLIGSTTGCTFAPGTGDLQGVDPLLGPLSDNGGFTQTHALLKGSAAIDAGGTDCAPTDQRGVPRSACDIGAYELAFCQKVAVNRVGTTGKDVLLGNAARDGFLGFQGNDTLRGKGGKDGLCGGPGKDKLKGGGGNDRLDGGPGKDLCAGQAGKKDRARKCEAEKAIP
jgi:CSLREA domain-containing protein